VGWVGQGWDGIHVFAPDDDALIGVILLPEICANCVFGGSKRNRLFMGCEPVPVCRVREYPGRALRGRVVSRSGRRRVRPAPVPSASRSRAAVARARTVFGSKSSGAGPGPGWMQIAVAGGSSDRYLAGAATVEAGP
jgi:hypothetical protein